MKTLLKFINTEMKTVGIDYHFGVNEKEKLIYPYFVGDLLPVDPISEDGRKEFTLVLDGFNRKSDVTEGTLFELLEVTEKIEEHFPHIGGRTAIVDNQAIAVFYCSCQPVDSGNPALQKVQINLSIKTWKGGNKE